MAVSVTPELGGVSGLNTLGCGRYYAAVYTRGGGEIVFDNLPVTSVKWERVLNDTSTGSVGLAGLGPAGACFAALRDGDTRHELAIIRGGSIVWQGPLTGKDGQGETGSYDASDLTAWWDWRRLGVFDRRYTDTDLATIFAQLAADAMYEDPSPNITIDTAPTGIVGTRTYIAGQYLLAGPELRELTNAGVDWTAVGRSVLVGGRVVPTSPIVLLQDAHVVGTPKVSMDGKSQRNRVGVAGAGGGGDAPLPVFGEAQDDDSIATYGLRDDVTSEDRAKDATSSAAAAASRLALVKDPPVLLDTITLDSDAPVLVSDLVPGALVGCAFTNTAIPVSGTYRIKRVAGSGQGTGETITLTLQPVGTTGAGE